jgi:hypothetical protein
MRCAKILMLQCFGEAQAYPEVRRAFSEVAGAQEIGADRRQEPLSLGWHESCVRPDSLRSCAAPLEVEMAPSVRKEAQGDGGGNGARPSTPGSRVSPRSWRPWYRDSLQQCRDSLQQCRDSLQQCRDVASEVNPGVLAKPSSSLTRGSRPAGCGACPQAGPPGRSCAARRDGLRRCTARPHLGEPGRVRSCHAGFRGKSDAPSPRGPNRHGADFAACPK